MVSILRGIFTISRLIWGLFFSKKHKYKYQCPCCDYFTLETKAGYDICPVCFWEDDGLEFENLDEESGPNKITLREGRANFKKHGACDIKMVPNVLSEKERKAYKYKAREEK